MKTYIHAVGADASWNRALLSYRYLISVHLAFGATLRLLSNSNKAEHSERLHLRGRQHGNGAADSRQHMKFNAAADRVEFQLTDDVLGLHCTSSTRA